MQLPTQKQVDTLHLSMFLFVAGEICIDADNLTSEHHWRIGSEIGSEVQNCGNSDEIAGEIAGGAARTAILRRAGSACHEPAV